MSIFPWVRIWIGVDNIEPLTPESWFEEGHGFKGGKKDDDGIWMTYYSKGTFLWAHDPSVGDLVLRKLGKAVHKRPNNLHGLICLKVMMPVWGRLLLNTDDLVIYGSPGGMFWPYSMHEFLVLGFISLLIPHRHWQLRGTPKVMVL